MAGMTGQKLINTERKKERGKSLKVLLPSSKYMTERRGDSIDDDNSSSWYKP